MKKLSFILVFLLFYGCPGIVEKYVPNDKKLKVIKNMYSTVYIGNFSCFSNNKPVDCSSVSDVKDPNFKFGSAGRQYPPEAYCAIIKELNDDNKVIKMRVQASFDECSKPWNMMLTTEFTLGSVTDVNTWDEEDLYLAMLNKVINSTQYFSISCEKAPDLHCVYNMKCGREQSILESKYLELSDTILFSDMEFNSSTTTGYIFSCSPNGVVCYGKDLKPQNINGASCSVSYDASKKNIEIIATDANGGKTKPAKPTRGGGTLTPAPDTGGGRGN